MKSCILVNYWADTEEKIDVVVKCIKQLRKSGKEVFYSSVIPIDEKIQNVSNFVLFDKENPVITMDDQFSVPNLPIANSFSWQGDGIFLFSKELNHIDVQYSLLIQIQKNIKLMKELGYSHFHFFHGDNILVDSDIETLTHLEKTCLALKKKGFFEDTEHGYRTLYFFSEIDFFLNYSGNYSSKIDFIQQNSHHWSNLNFELYIKSRFHPLSDKTIVGNQGVLSEDGAIYIFKDSKETIDLYSNYNSQTKIVIIPNKNNTIIDLYILGVQSGNYQGYKNDDLVISLDCKDSGYWSMINLPKEPFILKIYKNNSIFFEMDITKEKLDKICNSISFYTN